MGFDKIKKLAIGVAMMTSVAAAMPASAAVIGDFQLNGDLNNQAGGALTLTNNGGTLGANGITFGANQGPTISGFTSPSAYSVEVAFSFDNLSGYRKILDFQNLTSDSGLYNLNERLNFYPVVTSGQTNFFTGQMAHLVFTHDATDSWGYIGNNPALTFSGGNNSLADIGSLLHFFRDDFATSQGEASSGFVDYIRIYDTALTANEVAGLSVSAIPEPETYAMLLAGLGLLGFAARRRKQKAA